MRTMLISGAGSGIGRATAIALACQGNRIVLSGRRGETLSETREMLEGDDHVVVVADVSDATRLRNALAGAGIDVLHAVIANAGIGGENRFGEDDRWSEIIDTNLTGTYNLVNLCLPLLRAGRGEDDYRHVLIVSSILARLGVPGYSAYCASKAGLLGLMRSWASELAAEQILVNAICPGWVDTEMAREGIRGFAEGGGVSFDEARAEQMAMVPLGKMSEPEEIAAFIGYLTGPGQVSITGQTLDINNGAQMPS